MLFIRHNPALRLTATSAATEEMGFLHLYADASMPVWGVLAMLSNFLLAVFGRTGQRWFYALSSVTFLLFVIV